MTDTPTTAGPSGFRRYLKPGWIALGLVVFLMVAGCITGLALYGTQQSVLSEGNQQEKTLNAAYTETENFLSDCLITTKQKAQTATAFSDKLNDILSNAIRGRYDTSPNSGTPSGTLLFKALQEAYPDLSSVERVFQEVMHEISNCRTNVRDKQSTLSDKVRGFDSWRTGSWKVRTFGKEFPNQELIAQIGPTDLKYGLEALNAMRFVMSDADAAQARKTGVIPNQDLYGNGGKTPSPQPSGPAGSPSPTNSPR
jgi:hypothetical protein